MREKQTADMYLIDNLPPEVILQIAEYLDYDATLALAKWVLNLGMISSSSTHCIILGLARGGERSWPKSRWKRGKRLLVSAEEISRQRERPSTENGAPARSAPSARKPLLRRGGTRSWFCDTAPTSLWIDANCARPAKLAGRSIDFIINDFRVLFGKWSWWEKKQQLGDMIVFPS